MPTVVSPSHLLRVLPLITCTLVLGACDLSDLTEGAPATDDSDSSPGGAPGGSASGGGENGDQRGDDFCDGWSFCATFDGTGAPSPAQFDTIRPDVDDERNGTIEVVDGILRASISSPLDCTYADVGVERSGPFRGAVVDTLIKRQSVDGFFLTMNQIDSGGKSCLHLLALTEEGILLQTNASDPNNAGQTMTEASPLTLPWADEEFNELEWTLELEGEGARLTVRLQEQQQSEMRALCPGSAEVHVTAGYFCHGGTGTLEYDHLRVRLLSD